MRCRLSACNLRAHGLQEGACLPDTRFGAPGRLFRAIQFLLRTAPSTHDVDDGTVNPQEFVMVVLLAFSAAGSVFALILAACVLYLLIVVIGHRVHPVSPMRSRAKPAPARRSVGNSTNRHPARETDWQR